MCIRRQIKAISTIKMADKVISCAWKPIFCFITSASAEIWQDVGGTTFNAPFFHWLAPGIPSWLAESLARVCECDNKDIIIYENTSQSQDSQRNECEVIVGKHVNTPWRCGELCTARHVGEPRLTTEAHGWGWWKHAVRRRRWCEWVVKYDMWPGGGVARVETSFSHPPALFAAEMVSFTNFVVLIWFIK